jgi:hypothetical protein
MAYSSSLTGEEWEISEPLSLQTIPKERKHDLAIGQSERSLMESSINSKMGAIGKTCPKTYRLTRRFIGTTSSGKKQECSNT